MSFKPNNGRTASEPSGLRLFRISRKAYSGSSTHRHKVKIERSLKGATVDCRESMKKFSRVYVLSHTEMIAIDLLLFYDDECDDDLGTLWG
ncbi:hypothetical protein KIN20_000451 [Parelaphostrongylus tenuis]|uniref:Uncharacterized protein n=1 Tax=Parelaphostrongylus tenuis TaxID=148309 RepID=A0AAD5MBE1_PARTN|nr:hypothetical protein KIN20_000451 [Parelaphostrongylus tenuis]